MEGTFELMFLVSCGLFDFVQDKKFLKSRRKTNYCIDLIIVIVWSSNMMTLKEHITVLIESLASNPLRCLRLKCRY